MAVDLYVWLAYRLHVLGRPIEIGWPALKEQFGEGYKELRFFRHNVLPSIELALAAYPEARVRKPPRWGFPTPLLTIRLGLPRGSFLTLSAYATESTVRWLRPTGDRETADDPG